MDDLYTLVFETRDGWHFAVLGLDGAPAVISTFNAAIAADVPEAFQAWLRMCHFARERAEALVAREVEWLEGE